VADRASPRGLGHLGDLDLCASPDTTCVTRKLDGYRQCVQPDVEYRPLTVRGGITARARKAKEPDRRVGAAGPVHKPAPGSLGCGHDHSARSLLSGVAGCLAVGLWENAIAGTLERC
jgi:hypothetical protein